MKKLVWLAVFLLPLAVAAADEAPQTPVAPSEAPTGTCSTPLLPSEMTDEQLAKWSEDGNLIVDLKPVGGGPRCPVDPRRCPNAAGGCEPTSNCSLSNTGLTSCTTSDGASVSCKYGQTVHVQDCICDGPGAVCLTDTGRILLVCN